MLAVLGLAAGATSCSRDEAPQVQMAVRDSVGVHIVENTAPAWERPWVITDSPLFRVGDVSGQPEYELFRVTSAVRLSDGRLVIGNSGTSEVRWYSETGAFIRSAGRSGQGPGEFSLLSVVFPIGGDSIAVGDPRLRRLSIFDPESEFVRSIPFGDAGLASPVARFADGAYLLTTSGFALGAQGPTRIERLIMSVYRFRESGQGAQIIASLPWMEMVIGPTGGISRDGSVPIGQNPRAFGRNTWVTADSIGWIVGDNDRPELQFRSSAGEVTRIVRWSGRQREVTANDLERSRERSLALQEDPAVRRRMRAAMGQRPAPPETMPAFGWAWRTGTGPALLLDGERNVWVKEYSPAAEEDANRFLVFDSTGVWLGFVTAPLRLGLLSIGNDYVIGKSENELGVEIVSVHGIVKPD